MSVRVMSWVWDHSQAEGTDRLVLLAISDSADHDGSNAWPSVSTIAQKARISERTVQRSIRSLVALGELLVEDQAGGHAGVRADRRPNRYRVVMAPAQDGVSDRHPEGDGVTSGASRGDIQGPDGVTLVSPNPSSDPSLDPSREASDVPDVLDAKALEVLRLANLLADLIEANGSKRPNLTTSGFLDPIRLLIDRDGKTAEQVERAIRWSQKDEFWRSNILSGKSLRAKYDQMRLQASRSRPGSLEQVRDAAAEYLARKETA